MTPTPPLPKLPEWIECDEAVRNGSATALQAFIESQEPAGIAEQEEFRTKLQLALSEALSQRGEAVATTWAVYDSQGFYELHLCEDSASKWCEKYNARANDPLKPYTYRKCFVFDAAPQPAQPDVLSLLLSDEVLEAATLAHEQSSCHDLIGPMSDALKAAAERVRAMVPARPSIEPVIEWLRNHYQDHLNIASLTDAMREAFAAQPAKPVPASDYRKIAEDLESALERLVDLCTNTPGVVGLSDEVIFAEAALERLHKLRTAPAPCQGANCGSTDGLTHSAECLAEHAATIDRRAKPVPMKEAEARAEFNRQLDGFNKRGYAENMPNDFCDFLLGIRFAESFHHIKEQP